MSARLTLASIEDLPRLAPLVTKFHDEFGIQMSEDARVNTLATLLEGVPQGVAYLIGPNSAPVGYIIVSFGFSVEMGGLDAMIDEFYIRRGVRGRGMGGEVLRALIPALGQHGVRAMHLEVDTIGASKTLYKRMGFVPREHHHLMTRVL